MRNSKAILIIVFTSFLSSAIPSTSLYLSDSEITNIIQKGGWSDDPWLDSDTPMSERMDFSSDGTVCFTNGIAPSACQYLVLNGVIYIGGKDLKYPIKEKLSAPTRMTKTELEKCSQYLLQLDTISIFGKYKLIHKGNGAQPLYSHTFSRQLAGETRLFNNYKIIMSDIPENKSANECFYFDPDGKALFPLRAYGIYSDVSVVYTIDQLHIFGSLPTQGWKYGPSITYIGSTIIGKQKWFLGAITGINPSGDALDEVRKYVWTKGAIEPLNIIYKYYSYINNEKFDDAYSLWHKKLSKASFQSLYMGYLIVPLGIETINDCNYWVYVRLKRIPIDNELSDRTQEKYYKVFMTLSNFGIESSSSEEIGELDAMDIYNKNYQLSMQNDG